MTNFASCMLEVTGDEKDLQEFTSTIDGEFSMNQTVPRPGVPDADWAEENWGTKWDVCYPDVEIDEADQIVIAFDTAWDAPAEWLKKVALKFPKLRFRIAWSQVVGGGYGIILAKGESYVDVSREIGEDIKKDEDGAYAAGKYRKFLDKYGTGTGS